ncbi:MIP/aquaporin family protein [Lactococcus formosensis]|jgi:aquaporin Z|uniref:MIP family channel protein n=6 Tax=Lactococcus formosensis TaxID=1281486 RepID=A0A9Q8Y1P5_9LACT|nr:MIP family channel protein [Lactococcus formosensis]MCH1722499.1 MIP family channel protein [Lactococcus formosensis]MDG6116447.1 MIP family channel protein [Lactococcus formosensis]MDG6122584.1 MIP family channel protein [Lactococcus formosensis]MDG6127251.1 MIP family channel protein [Lactococcus formosensis]MDG6129194.1 MIP family channel protein [Lactococcus formosensis]
MRKYFAEFIGTFVLVFLGTGTVAIANTGETAIGYLGIGLAFGLAVTIMACAVGGVSGGHFNPAVSLAMMINKRLAIKDGIAYVISQFVGALAASAVLSIFIKALNLPKDGFGQTDFPNITAGEAFLFEAIITFLFVFVILMVTSEKYGNAVLAPVAIGLALAFLIIVALNLTGGSLNPARSFGPAVFAGGTALSHYWVYLLAPLVGAAIAAVTAKFMGSEE